MPKPKKRKKNLRVVKYANGNVSWSIIREDGEEFYSGYIGYPKSKQPIISSATFADCKRVIATELLANLKAINEDFLDSLQELNYSEED